MFKLIFKITVTSKINFNKINGAQLFKLTIVNINYKYIITTYRLQVIIMSVIYMQVYKVVEYVNLQNNFTICFYLGIKLISKVRFRIYLFFC